MARHAQASRTETGNGRLHSNLTFPFAKASAISPARGAGLDPGASGPDGLRARESGIRAYPPAFAAGGLLVEQFQDFLPDVLQGNAGRNPIPLIILQVMGLGQAPDLAHPLRFFLGIFDRRRPELRNGLRLERDPFQIRSRLRSELPKRAAPLATGWIEGVRQPDRRGSPLSWADPFELPEFLANPLLCT